MDNPNTQLTAQSNPDGVATFSSNLVGNAVIQCAGGTYTDEASGLPATLTSTLTAVVATASNNIMLAVTPLTQLAFQRAGGSNTATITATIATDALLRNGEVGRQFGLAGTGTATADVTTLIPTDLEAPNAVIDPDNPNDRYAIALAGISQIGSDTASVSSSTDTAAVITVLNNTRTASINTLFDNALIAIAAGGNSTVTARIDNTATSTIRANSSATAVAVASVTLSLSPTNTFVGQTAMTSTTVLPATAVNTAFTYTSSNPSVARIDASGLITAIGAGTTTITASNSDASGTQLFTVSDTENPSANAGSNQSNINGGVSVTLDAANSSDNIGVTSYTWTQISGTSATITNGPNATATFTAPMLSAAQTLSFQVVVGDSAGNTDAATVDIGINGDTTNPSANAGSNQSNINGGVSVTLDASGSSDNIGITSYTWTQTSGTSAATITNDSNATATFTAPMLSVAQTLSFQVVVGDSAGNTDAATVDIGINAFVAAPTNLNATPLGGLVGSPTADVVRVTWTAVANADSYTVYYAGTTRTVTAVLPFNGITDPDNLSIDDDNSYAQTTTIGTTFTTPTLDGKRYYFAVTTTIGNNQSLLSEVRNVVPFATVASPESTARVWMSRNLGAIQDCTSSTDTACYGDLYQWGRAADGHQRIDRTTPGNCFDNSDQSVLCNTLITTDLATTITGTVAEPSANFIIGASDWTQSGVDNTGTLRADAWADGGVNDICPVGFSVPTATELRSDTTNANMTEVTGAPSAFASFLRLPAAGFRNADASNPDASLIGVDDRSFLWSRSVSADIDNSANSVFFLQSLADGNANSVFSSAYSVRCIQD